MPSRQDLHPYQNKTIEFIKNRKRCGLALFMGAGKTTITLTAVSDLSDGMMVNKVLVIAPLRVANTVWKQEAKKWEHLKHLEIVICTGTEKQRLAALHRKADVYVINRENVVWLTDLYKKRFPFDCVLVDECFPEGTEILTPTGVIDIKLLKCGDLVMTSKGPMPVTNTFKRESNEIYKLHFSDGGSVECTGEHPFATEKGWVQARRCRGLFVVRSCFHEEAVNSSSMQQKLLQKTHAFNKTFRGKIRSSSKRIRDGQEKLCFWKKKNLDRRETLARRNEKKIERCSQSFWSLSENSRGEWESFRVRGFNARNTIGRLGDAICNPDKNKRWERLSNLLQSRFCKSRKKMGFRNRWKFSHISKSVGREERFFSKLVRVDRVENLKQTSETTVYNLETDGINDYFANGILVHNCHSFKSPDSKRFKALKKVAHQINYITLLSGTPAPNGLLDLWSQQFLIDFGMTLGRTMTAYKQRFFDTDYMGYTFTPKLGAPDDVQRLISPHWLSMVAEDYITLPDRIDIVISIPLQPNVLKLYKEFEKNMYTALPDNEEIEALSAATLAGKMLQLANGSVYTDDKKNYSIIHDAKLDALQEIVEDNAGEPILVAYNYKHDLVRLKAKFPQAVVLDTGNTMVEKWNRGEIPMLLTHPQSSSLGLNLAQGGCIAVWFGLTWSLDSYLQWNARLHRQGQTRPVRIIHLVAEGTIDERVMSVIKNKNATQDQLLDALKKEIDAIKNNS